MLEHNNLPPLHHDLWDALRDLTEPGTEVPDDVELEIQKYGQACAAAAVAAHVSKERERFGVAFAAAVSVPYHDASMGEHADMTAVADLAIDRLAAATQPQAVPTQGDKS